MGMDGGYDEVGRRCYEVDGLVDGWIIELIIRRCYGKVVRCKIAKGGLKVVEVVERGDGFCGEGIIAGCERGRGLFFVFPTLAFSLIKKWEIVLECGGSG